jgi:NADPH:quinone reductase-like Zn-dependent oxidoreductase
MGASGNLGSVGIQIAKNVVGAKVICTAGSRARADKGLAFGADHAIDYSTQDILEEIMRITGGRGVDVLYDNIANPDILPKAFHGVGYDGRVVTAGAHGGPNVTIDFFHLYDRRIMIKGQPGSRDGDLPACFEAAAQGKIKVSIAHVLPLSQAAKAHAMMEADPGMGKIVLDPTLG